MKILVTGGAGFIGSHVVDSYITKGHEVSVVDNLCTGKRKNLNASAKFYLMDIRSELLKIVFEIEKPEIVNHHAAQPSVPASMENPLFDAEVNITGLVNLLESPTLPYAQIYGPRQVPHGEASVIAIFMGKLLSGEVPIIYPYDREPDE